MFEILIVDDDSKERKQIVNLFSKKDVKIKEAASGVEAIDLIGKHPTFDIAVIDIIMPGLHGLDTMSRLKKLKPDLIVFLIGGEREYKLGQRGLKIGATGVMKKPLTTEEVDSIIEIVQKTKVNQVSEFINFNFDTLINFTQKIVDLPPSRKLLEITAEESKKETGFDEIILFEIDKTKNFIQSFPKNDLELELIDIPEKEVLNENDISDYIIGIENSEFNSILPLKNRDKIMGFIIIKSNKSIEQHYLLLIEKFFALTLKLIWMQESLIDTIDMQAKAESEAGELKDKLSRAVSLLEKMKEKMGKK